MDTARLKVAGGLTLKADDGSDLAVTAVSTELDLAGGRLWGCRISFSVSVDDWKRIDAGGWFHMPADVRGPVFADGFSDDHELSITARLRADGMKLLAGMGTADKWDLAAELLEPKHNPALHQADSWDGLTVSQQRGDVKTGFATKASGLRF